MYPRGDVSEEGGIEMGPVGGSNINQKLYDLLQKSIETVWLMSVFIIIKTSVEIQETILGHKYLIPNICWNGSMMFY